MTLPLPNGERSTSSAATNVVSPMQKLGLLDENGNLTDRGHKWRSGDSYAEACQEILDEIYPADLAGFTTANGDPDRSMVTKWFQQQKFGDSNASKMAATYVMIAEKKVAEPPGDKETKGKAKKQAPGTAVRATNSISRSASPSAREDAATTSARPPQTAPPVVRPDIHLDFQIHIAADAKPEVIEQIFASMAKHLYPTA